VRDNLLFVYGTLRFAFDGPMARRLQAEARHMGPARADGMLYRLAGYPGFVPGAEGMVTGDLFALTDADATLVWLDDYEECATHSPQPHEYRRLWMTVAGLDGPVAAWTYAYARDPSGWPIIASGDFLK
jgi:gamma-glutamylcyclotransferase (GGCT)/AIG2-like uncharacterized protein YtfP